jgi:Raf kinase inhibitor-like YbhB/YbcL family protein
MKLTSPDFENNNHIPKKFTCQGQDINPALIIADIPDGTASLALIVDDPDAPMSTWVHWVVFNIPVTNRIDESSVPGAQGITSNGKMGYHGPCPPSGTHRYFFNIYALDASLTPQKEIDKKGLEEIMRDHILDKAELMGLYKKV